MLPNSPITASMRCNTEARRRPVSPSPTELAGAGLQGPRPGQPGVRRADAGRDARPRRHRPLPLLHHRLDHVGERPAGVPQHRGGYRACVGPQRKPGQHHRPGAPGSRRRPDQPQHARRGHHRLRHPRRPAGSRRGGLQHRAGRPGTAAHRPRRVLPDLHGREHPLRRTRPVRGAPAVAGPARPRLGGRLRNRRARHRRRLLRPRHRARRAAGHRRRRRALEPVRQPDAEGLRLRVRLPGPPGQHPGRALGTRRASRHRPPAGPREAGRGRPRHRCSGVRHPRCRRLRAGVRNPLRSGPDEERLRRAHLHPAVADHSSARHPAQAQPAQRGDPRQAADRRRRLDRARQHPAGA